MYWENEEEKAEKEDRLDDVEICWKCVMCGICGDGPASTGIVCRKKNCKKERSRLIPCDGCGMRYTPETYEQQGTCPKCVKLFAEDDGSAFLQMIRAMGVPSCMPPSSSQ